MAVFFAFVAASVWGAVIVMDKTVVSNYVDDDRVLLAFSVLIAALVALPLTVSPAIEIPSLMLGLELFAIGMLSNLPVYLYLKALRYDDATVVGSLLKLGPVVTLILAFLFLDEMLVFMDYLGVGMIVGGSILAALVTEKGSLTLNVNKSLGLVILATIGWGAEAVVMKHALMYTDFWNVFYWSRLFGAVFLIPLLFVPSVRSGMMNVVHNPLRKGLGYIVGAEVGFTFGVLMVTIALSTGSATIVMAITSTETLFVLLFAGALHFFGYDMEADTSRPAVMKKVVGGVMSVLGAIIIV